MESVSEKYNDLCMKVRDMAKAGAAVVVIANGKNGSGYGLQTDGDSLYRLSLPLMLRGIADEIYRIAYEMRGNADELYRIAKKIECDLEEESEGADR